MNFNAKEINTLSGALMSACGKYRECVNALEASNMDDSSKRELVDQFKQQIADCQAVAEKIDNLNEQ
jgi:hypothetical protein